MHTNIIDKKTCLVKTKKGYFLSGLFVYNENMLEKIPAKIFSENLKRIAKEKRITKQFIAKSLKIHWDTVNKWFKGERTPSLETIYKLASVLNVPIERLLIEPKPEPFVGYYDVISLPFSERFKKVFELAGKHAGFNGPILHALEERVFKDEKPRLETEEEIVAEYQKWLKWFEEKKKLLLEE